MEIEILEMPEMRAGTVRGDLAHAQELWGQLGALAGSSGLMGQPGVMMAAILPVDVIPPPGESHARPMEEIEYHAAMIVPADAAIPAGLTEERVPGGRYARAVYLGPYEGLAGAWGEFTGQWLPSSGQQLGSGVCYEIYRNDPTSTPEAELQTDLYIPLA